MKAAELPRCVQFEQLVVFDCLVLGLTAFETFLHVHTSTAREYLSWVHIITQPNLRHAQQLRLVARVAEMDFKIGEKHFKEIIHYHIFSTCPPDHLVFKLQLINHGDVVLLLDRQPILRRDLGLHELEIP